MWYGREKGELEAIRHAELVKNIREVVLTVFTLIENFAAISLFGSATTVETIWSSRAVRQSRTTLHGFGRDARARILSITLPMHSRRPNIRRHYGPDALEQHSLAVCFITTPRAPSWSASTTSASSTEAVRRSVRIAGVIVESSRSVSRPGTSGIAKSSRRRSAQLANQLIASWPSLASPMSWSVGSVSSSCATPHETADDRRR